MAAPIYARPIAALLFALIGGIFLGHRLPGHVAAAAMIIAFSAGLTIVSIRRRKATCWTPIIFFAALGYASIQPWISPDFPTDHIQSFSEDTRWQISGVVDSEPRDFKYLKKFILQAEALEYKKAVYRVQGKIRVTVRGRAPEIARGDRVEFRSRLRRPRNFNNPGGFDYQRYMAFKGIWRTAYTRGDRLRVVDANAAPDMFRRVDAARRAMVSLIENAGGKPSAAVLKALIIGDRSDISLQLRDKFNRAGVGHILAISGLHIGIVATVAFFLFQRFLRLIRPLLWRAWTHKVAAILTLFPVCIYGLISGMSPSTQRAVIMVCAFLLTFVVERERDALNILALAAFIILIVYPPALFSISFQLSFAAVLSILYGMICWQTRSDNQLGAAGGFGPQLYRKLLSFFLVSVFAIGGTIPLVMVYFNQISLIGLLANFFVIPLVGFGVIPCGLLALFIFPISSQLAFAGVKICLFMLDIAMAVITFLAELPFAALKTFTPSVLEIVCYYLVAWVVLQLLKVRPASPVTAHQPYAPSGAISPAGRSLQNLGVIGRNRFFLILAAAGRWISSKLSGRGAAIIGLGVIVVLVADAGYWISRRYWNSDLRVTYIDVGQGNAALLELPGGYTALIDGGGYSDNNAFDMGARVIAPLLLRKKIRTVDTLVLSHPNSDHLNGLIYIAEHFKVKTIWANGETRNTRGYQDFRDVIDRKGIELSDFQQLGRRQQINGLEFSVLYPPSDFMARKTVDKWRNSNNNSLVVKVSFGEISFLFPGDITTRAEQELVAAAGSTLACDVLLVPHHGSRSSSSKRFVETARPDIAVISAGWKNRFRFPHPSVLETYRNNGCRIFRTDFNGAIVIETNGEHLTVKPFISSDNPFAIF